MDIGETSEGYVKEIVSVGRLEIREYPEKTVETFGNRMVHFDLFWDDVVKFPVHREAVEEALKRWDRYWDWDKCVQHYGTLDQLVTLHPL